MDKTSALTNNRKGYKSANPAAWHKIKNYAFIERRTA